MCNKSVKVKKITVNMSRKSKFAWAFLLSLRALFIYSPVGEIFTGRNDAHSAGQSGQNVFKGRVVGAQQQMLLMWL